MFQILSITLALVIGAILIVVLTGKKSKRPYNLSGMMKWSSEQHAGEETNTSVVNHLFTSKSKSIHIIFDFEKNKGELLDKAIDKKYHIMVVDGDYVIIPKKSK